LRFKRKTQKNANKTNRRKMPRIGERRIPQKRLRTFGETLGLFLRENAIYNHGHHILNILCTIFEKMSTGKLVCLQFGEDGDIPQGA
jgi:hypothetical protein